jgi:hypothetical protein
LSGLPSNQFVIRLDMASDMAKLDPTKDPEFKRVLGNLLKAPPKHHSEMKLGTKKRRPAKANRRPPVKSEP